MRRSLVSVLVVALLALPASVAHPVALPGEWCGPRPDHHYAVGASAVANTMLTTFTWRTTVVLFDSCPLDGEGDFGTGGGFLPADHHTAMPVCVFDETTHAVSFIIGISEFVPGVISRQTQIWTGCGPAIDALGPMPPGLDGGWWVFLVSGYDRSTGVLSVPTVGHIYG